MYEIHKDGKNSKHTPYLLTPTKLNSAAKKTLSNWEYSRCKSLTEMVAYLEYWYGWVIGKPPGFYEVD